MMAKATTRSFSVILLALFLMESARGQDTESATEPAQVTDKQIAQLIKDLDSDTFETRQQAAIQLKEAGPRAFGAMAKCALEGSLEARMRCFKMLAREFQSDDEGVSAAAKKALEQLAKSDHRSVANKAKSVLTEPKPTTPGINGALQEHRIEHTGKSGNSAWAVVRAVGGTGPVRVQIQMDGERVTEVKEAGKLIRIVEDELGPITISITEKDKTTRIEAKNPAELKKGPIKIVIIEKHNDKEKITEIEAKNPAEFKKQSQGAYELYRKYVRPKQARN